MATPSLGRPVQQSLYLPPIARLPGAPASSDENALQDLLLRSQDWGRHRIGIPVAVTWAFWLIATGSAAVGIWTAALLADRASCGGVVCRIALLGDRPRLVLTLAAFCVVVLLVLALVTDGLTRAGGPELAFMVAAGGAGVVSVLGVAAVVVLTLMVALLGAVALVLLLDRD